MQTTQRLCIRVYKTMSGLLDILTKSDPIFKSVEVVGATTTITIWTPTSGKHIVLTGLDIVNVSGTSGTILIFFSSGNAPSQRVTMQALNATESVSLRYPGIGNGVADILLRGVAGPATNAYSVTAIGFEL